MMIDCNGTIYNCTQCTRKWVAQWRRKIYDALSSSATARICGNWYLWKVGSEISKKGLPHHFWPPHKVGNNFPAILHIREILHKDYHHTPDAGMKSLNVSAIRLTEKAYWKFTPILVQNGCRNSFSTIYHSQTTGQVESPIREILVGSSYHVQNRPKTVILFIDLLNFDYYTRFIKSRDARPSSLLSFDLSTSVVC